MSERLRVVVADDEPDVRLLLELQLSQYDDLAFAGAAADGLELLDLVDEIAPDVAVVDLLMPRMTGIEAIARLREVRPGLALVANTAVAGEFVRSEMRRLGAELVLKSGDATELVDAIRRAAARAQGAS